MEPESTNDEILAKVVELIKAGYVAGESVWNESIFHVQYMYGIEHDLMWVRGDAPHWVERTFCLSSMGDHHPMNKVAR